MIFADVYRNKCPMKFQQRIDNNDFPPQSEMPYEIKSTNIQSPRRLLLRRVYICMSQGLFDNVRRQRSPSLRRTDGRQSQRQRDYATFEASCEIDLKHPWRHTDAEITDLAARVRWPHIENEEALELLKALHDPSYRRTELHIKNLVDVLEELPTSLFWPVFLHTWPNCGQTWPFQKTLLRMFRHHADQDSAINYMHPAANEFFSLLPPMVIVFRSCAAGCSRGVSWTTTQNIAKQFALEHSGRRLNRVLATAKVNKKHIFAVCVERGESEIIVDPKYLQELQLSALAAN
jgi:hypothetical protein